MAIDTASPFIWGANGSQLTPAQAEAQRKVAQVLLTNGMDYSPVKSAWQGAARMAQAALGGFESGQADASDKATAAMQPKLLADAIAASQGGSPAAPVIGGSSGPGDTAVPPAGATAIPAGKDEFVSSVMPLAQEASAKTGLDPRLIVAQAALESGYGQHAPGNNLFGIKSHGQPGGNTLPTTEVVNGQPVQTSDSFRAYASPADSVSGYADFINANPRYAPVKAAQGLEGQAEALGQSGYATDPNYGSKVLQIARALPAPTDGVLAANSPSPLDNAQYPAGPVGAPTQAAGSPPVATASDGEDALPANAASTQGALPTAQAVQAATRPQSAVAKIAPLISAMNNPYASDATKKVAAVLLTSALEQQKQANDPLRQLQIKKAQQDTDKSDFEWKPVGRDANGQWSYGWVNSKTQEVRGRDGQPFQQGQQPTEDATAGLMGDDYLKAIPRDRADIARKVANGEIDVSSLPNRGNYRMQVLSDAARFDPTFNPIDYKTRLATRKDFTSGKSAQNITSFNTAIGHLDSLDKSIDNLGNRGSSWYNAATAPISGQIDQKYQVALKDFNTSKQAVIDELTRAFRGSGGNVYDLQEWEKSINATESPAALHAATRRAIELLRSRIDAVGDQYNRGMGKKTDPVELLSPKARATMERLEGTSDQPQEAAPAIDPAALAEARRRGLIK